MSLWPPSVVVCCCCRYPLIVWPRGAMVVYTNMSVVTFVVHTDVLLLLLASGGQRWANEYNCSISLSCDFMFTITKKRLWRRLLDEFVDHSKNTYLFWLSVPLPPRSFQNFLVFGGIFGVKSSIIKIDFFALDEFCYCLQYDVRGERENELANRSTSERKRTKEGIKRKY